MARCHLLDDTDGLHVDRVTREGRCHPMQTLELNIRYNAGGVGSLATEPAAGIDGKIPEAGLLRDCLKESVVGTASTIQRTISA